MALTIGSSLIAQTFDNEACYIVETDDGIQYTQRFEWENLVYVQKYEFHIEQKDAKKGTWNEIFCLETTDNSVEIPLDSGTYRYKIVVFNLLGQRELESDWIPIEIIKVYQPKVDSVTPSTIYLENLDGEVVLSGKGLLDSSQLTFRNEEGFQVDVQNLGSDEKFRELTMFAEPSLLVPGIYTLTINNEGGLSTTYEGINVKYRKPWDLDLSLGYTCLVNLFDSRFEDYFEKRFFPYGAGAKISVIPWKQNWGYLGIGVNGSYILMNDLSTEPVLTGYRITGNYIDGYLNFIYQYPIRNRKKNNNVRAIFEAHAGAGVVMLNDIAFHFPHNIDTEPFNIMYLSAQLGGSVQYFLTKRLYLELNCNFTFSPSADMMMGNLVPSLMIGWQF